MVKVSLKQSVGKASVVGEISLLNDGNTQKLWKVTSEDGTESFVPEEVFNKIYDVIEEQIPDYETLKAELSLKNEMLRNLQVEYLNSLTKNEFVEKNYKTLLNLSKETLLTLQKDIKEINSKSNEEFAALSETINNIVKSIV